MTLRARAIGLLVVTALLDAAPFSTALAQVSATPIDACTLLDAADIHKVLGVPVEKGTRRDSGLESNGAYSSACVWMLESERGLPKDPSAPLGGKSFVILNALRYPQGSGGARTYLEAFREASASGVLPARPSARQFGDEALWWGDGLAVRRRDVSFGISVFLQRAASTATHGQPGEREGRLAKTILARLAAQDVTSGGTAK
ncbi:MAG: hypothetical protein WDO56_36790 [Gammaproteobacteria bacterium]